MRHSLLLFLLFLFLYLLTFGGHLYSPDEEVMFRTVESLARHAALAIEPLYGFATRSGVDGKEYAQYGVGQPLAAVPFYWLGEGLHPLAPDAVWVELGRRIRADYVMFAEGAAPDVLGRGMAARLGVSLFNILITALSGVVLFRLARRLCGAAKPAWLAALLWGAGSIAWTHSRTFFSEPFAGLCLLATLALLARYFYPDKVRSVAESEDQSQPRGNLWLVVLAGAAIGYGCLVRLDSVVFLPALALLVAWGDFARSPEVAHLFCAARPRKRLLLLLNHLFQRPVLRRLILFAIPVALAGGIILGLNTLHFGAPFASAYSDQPEGITFSTPILAGLYGFLMSVGKGVFFFSPALVLCLFGIAPMLRRAPVFGAAILALFLSFLLFQSAWRNWAGGWCWGPRHIVQAHALLALPIAFWIAERWSSPRRVLLTSVLAIGALVQIYGCSQNFIEFYRVYYQDPAPPNATPLYDLQSSPELAYRYAIFLRGQDGQPEREIALTDLVAPINDSIYIVQNSPWPRYAEMARTLGLHDFFWLHLATPR